MPPRFVKNRAFEREMTVQPGTVAFMDATTVTAAATARELAPEKSGYYKRRIIAVGNKVRARDFAWHWVEFGSVNNIAYAPLRRALVALGLRLDEAPKK